MSEDLLSSSTSNNPNKYPTMSYQTSEHTSHGSLNITNPLNVINMTGGVDSHSEQQLPSSQTQVPNYRNVMIKPIVPKQAVQGPVSGTVIPPSPGGANVNYRTHPQKPSHHYPYSGAPSLHPPSTTPHSPILHSTTLPPSAQYPLTTPTHYPQQPAVQSTTSRGSSSSSVLSHKSLKFHDKSSSSQGGGASVTSSGGGVASNKPRKPCNCKNSQCLKLYCDCFANGEFCRESCNCQNCKNSRAYEDDRTKAVKACLERNPNAFKPKVGHAQVGDGRRHIKGCNCKKSGCLKNYCECYEAKIPCSYLCRCVSCQNVSDRSDGKGLMELANAADLRTQQQRAASSHFFEHIEVPVHTQIPTDAQKLPYSFVNKEITKATALCLLEEASHAASSGQNPVEIERAVLIEFGRCLEQIINSSESANNMRGSSDTGLVVKY